MEINIMNEILNDGFVLSIMLASTLYFSGFGSLISSAMSDFAFKYL